MKWFLKWLFRVVGALAVVAVGLLVFRDVLLRGVVEEEIRDQTGMTVKIGKLSTGWSSRFATIESLKVYNAPEFGGGLLLDAPELHLEFDRAAFTEGKLRVVLMRLNVAEFDVVINEAGQTNLVNLLAKASAFKEKRKKVRFAGRQFSFEGVQLLNLSVGKARFIDLRNPGHQQEARIDMQGEIFREVQTENDLNGIAAMIWLRSGGTLNFKPQVARQNGEEREGAGKK